MTKPSNNLFFSLGIALFIWLLFSWPLPRYAAEGIPCSSQNIELDGVREMIPGDHLQLLYHFWLFSDMLAGETPWFHNLYEFNTGDDSESYKPRAYRFPLSFVYSLFYYVSNHALAWNLMGFITLWLSFLATWLLCRRYSSSLSLATFAALISISFPYRWVQFLGGSPAGLSIMWIPICWLGADILLRDQKWKGALLCGIGLLGASFADQHVLYFLMLSLLPIGLIGLIQHSVEQKNRIAWSAILLKSLLSLFLFVLAIAHALLTKKGHAGAVSERSLQDIALASPQHSDFFTWGASGLGSHVFLGYALCISLALLSFYYLSRIEVGKYGLRKLLLCLIPLSFFFVALSLALGVNGPFDAIVLRGFRKGLPYFSMVRQPVKIFLLLPTLAPLLICICLTNIPKKIYCAKFVSAPSF